MDLYPFRGAARGLTAALLCLLGLAPWVPMIVRGEVPASKDALHFFPARRLYLENCLRAGEMPYWDPGRAFGQPGLGSPDNSAAYPVTWLAVAAAGGRRAILVEGVLHTWIALFLAYGFLRRAAADPAAALLGACAYGLSGIVLGTHWNPHHHAGAAWLPGVAWGAAAGHPVLLLGSLGMMALAPEPILLSASLGLLAIHYVVRAARERRPALAAIPILLAGGAVLLGAAQVLPARAFLPLTTRTSGFSLGRALEHALPAATAFTLAVPDRRIAADPEMAIAGWVPHLYAGFFVLLLAVRGAVSDFRRVWPALLLIALIVPLALGSSPPLFVWAHGHLPGFDRIRIPPKSLPLAALALAFVAARAQSGGRGPGPIGWGLGAALPVFLTAWFFLRWGRVEGVPPEAVRRTFVALLPAFAGVGVAVAAALLGRFRGGGIFAAAIVGLEIGLQAGLPSAPVAVVEASAFGRAMAGRARPGDRSRYAYLLPNDPTRYAPAPPGGFGEREWMQAVLRGVYLDAGRLIGVDNALDYWSLPSANIHAALRRVTADPGEFPIRFLIHRPDFSPPGMDLEPLAREGGLVLFLRRDPPAEVVFDGKARVVRRTMNTVEIEAESENGGPLVLKETWLPGWRGLLDAATPLEVREAHGWRREVTVPAGRRSVRLFYSPPGAAGIPISAAAWAALLAGGWVRRRRSRPIAQSPPAQGH